MASTKRSPGGRSTTRRPKTTTRARAAGASKSKAVARAKTAAKPKAVAKPKAAPPKAAARTKPVGKAKPVRQTKPAAASKPAKASGRDESAEIVALKAKFQRERNGLEKRLTEAVREIGLLRHHELRATQLERQLADRDATIERLQQQLGELERRPPEPIYVREVQQSLALGEPDGATTDLDEFEDDRLGDEADLVSDED